MQPLIQIVDASPETTVEVTDTIRVRDYITVDGTPYDLLIAWPAVLAVAAKALAAALAQRLGEALGDALVDGMLGKSNYDRQIRDRLNQLEAIVSQIWKFMSEQLPELVARKFDETLVLHEINFLRGKTLTVSSEVSLFNTRNREYEDAKTAYEDAVEAGASADILDALRIARDKKFDDRKRSAERMATTARDALEYGSALLNNGGKESYVEHIHVWSAVLPAISLAVSTDKALADLFPIFASRYASVLRSWIDPKIGDSFTSRAASLKGELDEATANMTDPNSAYNRDFLFWVERQKEEDSGQKWWVGGAALLNDYKPDYNNGEGRWFGDLHRDSGRIADLGEVTPPWNKIAAAIPFHPGTGPCRKLPWWDPVVGQRVNNEWPRLLGFVDRWSRQMRHNPGRLQACQDAKEAVEKLTICCEAVATLSSRSDVTSLMI